MKRWITRYAPLALLLISTLTAGAEHEQPDRKTLEAFTKAGFTLHGEIYGFYSNSRAVKTPEGIILPGRISQIGQAAWEGPAAIFHVATGETTIIAPPDIGPGADKPWGTFDKSNRKGWVVGTTYQHKDGDGDHLDQAYLRKLDDTLIHIPAPPSNQIAPCDINDAGQVVGWYSPTRNWRGFVWSQKEGFIDLGENGADQVQAVAINKHGMIVGNVQKNGVMYPRVWLPPKQLGAEHEAKTLGIPDGHDGAAADDVNDSSVVLITATRRIKNPTKPEKHNTVFAPYTWTAKSGFQEVHHPEAEFISPQAVAEDRSVLLWCWKKRDPIPWNHRSAMYYLSKGKMLTQLPNYPGATHTEYRAMSDEELITGLAYCHSDEDVASHSVISFVISVKKDQPKMVSQRVNRSKGNKE